MRSMLLLLLLLGNVMAADAAPSRIVLAGGGAEGDVGDTAAWSYELYHALLMGGDITGDDVVRVAILATDLGGDPSFLPSYFTWLGTTLDITAEGVNVEVTTVAAADDPAVVDVVASCDAVFIKGGDQGLYYDLWNDTRLEVHINGIAMAGGALGGTSAGAMSWAQYSFSGGADLISRDVLADAHTVYLDDTSQPGTSGIHTDFLPFVSGVTIDTHYTQRGRMGRLIGILARALDDHQRRDLLAIGLERNTGIVIQNDTAEVHGIGEVAFIQPTLGTWLVRDPGRPLIVTELRLDRLTEGWRYDLVAKRPDTDNPPAGVNAITATGDGSANVGALDLDGGLEADSALFAATATYYPDDYSLVAAASEPHIHDTVGFTRAGITAERADKQENLFRLLYDRPRVTGMLVFDDSEVSRTSAAPDKLEFGPSGGAPELAVILVDASRAGYKGLSPSISNWAADSGSLRAAALTDLRIHVLAESGARDVRYDSREHVVEGSPVLLAVDFESGDTSGWSVIVE
ncbi:MAG: cyanophycinase [Acidobacteriota bacterium]